MSFDINFFTKFVPEISSLTQLSRSTVSIEARLGIIAHSEALSTNFTMG